MHLLAATRVAGLGQRCCKLGTHSSQVGLALSIVCFVPVGVYIASWRAALLLGPILSSVSTAHFPIQAIQHGRTCLLLCIYTVKTRESVWPRKP